MTKDKIASKINDFFKEYDSYNYRDNISHNADEEETIDEIANSLTNFSKINEILEKLESFRIESLDSECLEEAHKLEEIINDIKNYVDNNSLTILKVEPEKLPYEKTIINDLKALQLEVDGLIEMIDIDESVCIVCNEEGKILNLDFNRIVGNDIIAGNFFVVGFSEEGDTISLNKEQINKYKELYNEKSIDELNNQLISIKFDRGGKELC